MMGPVADRAAWSRIRSKASAVFDLDQRLPSRVSTLPVSSSPFFDGDVMFSSDAWAMISSLAGLHGDPSVHFLVLHPPELNFVVDGRWHGGFTIPADASADVYASRLFAPGADVERAVQIAYIGSVAAVTGDTGTWGIWAERDLAGLVVSRTPRLLAWWELDYGPFVSAEDISEHLLPIPGKRPEAIEWHEALVADLKRNYGLRDD